MFSGGSRRHCYSGGLSVRVVELADLDDGTTILVNGIPPGHATNQDTDMHWQSSDSTRTNRVSMDRGKTPSHYGTRLLGR